MGAQKKKGGGGEWKFTHFTSPGSAPENEVKILTLLSVILKLIFLSVILMNDHV